MNAPNLLLFCVPESAALDWLFFRKQDCDLMLQSLSIFGNEKIVAHVWNLRGGAIGFRLMLRELRFLSVWRNDGVVPPVTFRTGLPVVQRWAKRFEAIQVCAKNHRPRFMIAGNDDFARLVLCA